jgi:hypothetical protein
VRRATALTVLAVTAAAPVGAQSVAPVDSIVATRHTLVLNGRTIRYTARAGLLPLYVNDTGELIALVRPGASTALIPLRNFTLANAVPNHES